MLALSRKQMMVLLLVLVSFIVVLLASTMIIRATNPSMWQSLLNFAPQVLSHW